MVSSEKTSKSGFNISVSGTLDDMISETASIMSTLIEKVVEERPELARLAFLDMVNRASCFIEEKTGFDVLDTDSSQDDDDDDDSDYVSDEDMGKMFEALFGGGADSNDDSTVDDLPKYLF